ncbi:hypothetical protein MNBD_GAMMA22-2738 [hydrothermal vent metagenome]|uniref:DUF2066 domain-containing protein n=1 Tax=hydrothermal vent metagenome TaxID=652676 RepID=A0A3B0ZII0_9ZZZZ
MQKIIMLFVLTGLILSPVTVSAEVVKNLYDIKIPVFSQDRKERKEAIKTGLASVLVKVTGRSAVSDLLELEDVYRTAAQYVQQFRYLKMPKKNKSAVAESTLEPLPNKKLWIRFNKKAVNKMLRQRNLPVWGQTRPSALVWFVIDNNGRREFIGNDRDSSFHETILNYSKARGLPVRFPLMDLTDRVNIKTSDIWAGFDGTILKASERYHTEAIIVGRAFKSFSGAWNTRWTLYLNGNKQSWEFQDNDIVAALTPGIDQVTDNLSVRFTQVNIDQDNNQVLLKVTNIEDLADYTRVVKYISSISSVIQIQPYVLNKDNVIFNLTTRSGRIGVAQSISLGRLFVKDDVTVPNVEIDNSVPNEQTQQPANENVGVAIAYDLKYRLLK